MRNTITWLGLGLTAAVLTVAVATSYGQDSVGEKRMAQNKLLSQRAARVDAMRKLAERINGLQINSETKVQDFVATDDRIEAAMMSFLRGAKEVGDPRYTPDGVCEVTMEVTLQEVVTTLKKFCKEYYKGDKFTTQTFDQLTTTTKETTLRETGSGAPRPEFEDRGTMAPPTASGQDIMPPRAWDYWNAHCQARGRLMAVRAAEVDAMRKLGERINGLYINSETQVKDFVAESDDIRTQMTVFLKGARTEGVRYHDNELIVEVTKVVTLQDLVTNLKKWTEEYYKGKKVTSRDFEQMSTTIEERDIDETGSGVPPEKYLKDVQGPDAAAVGFGQQAMDWPGTLQAKGQAALDTSNPNAAQAKLMALRGAELDARRKLAEEIEGLEVSAKTTVRDFVAESDQIRTSVMTFQEGARRVKGSEKVLPDGTAEVVVEIDTQPLQNAVLYYQKQAR